MAQVIIKHPDGRRYEVSETAFTSLYEPFGFAVEGVVHNGAMLPATEANLKKANEASPTESDLTAETRERAVILADMEASARAKMAAESTTDTKASGSKSDGSKTGS